jgi:O-antigen/teichoic acid export membrane protein
MKQNVQKIIQTIKNHHIFHLIKNSLVYGFGDIIQRFLALFLLPIYTRYLKPEDYGITGLLSVLSMLLGTITMCGLTNGISRYFYYADKENATISEVIWSPFIFLCLFSPLILVPVGLASNTISLILFHTEQYAYLVILTLGAIFIGNLSSVGRSILIFQERAVTVNIINIIGILVGVASGLFMVVYLKRGVIGMVEAGFIGSFIMSIPTLIISMFRFKPAFSLSILVKEIKFSLPLVIALFAFWFMDSSDRYILKLFLPLSEIGLYDIGYNFGLVMMIVVGGFTLAWPPYYHKHNQNGQGQTICNSVLKSYLCITSICVVILSVASPLILKIFTTEKFHKAFTVVPWVAMAYMLKGPYIIFLMGVLVKNKTSWQLYLEIFAAVVNIMSNFLLIPLIGREAAAITTLLSYSIMCFGAYWMVMRINPISQFSYGFVLRTIILTIVISGGILFSSHYGWSYILSSTFLIMTFLGILTVTSLKEFKPLLLKVIQSD